MKKNILHKQAMSIIEVMIAIFIFTLGIASVFMIITSAGNINSYNKNFIIASNLAREQIELIRNIRDTNYKKFQKWNTLKPNSGNYNIVFTGSTTDFYKIENGVGVGGFHIKSSTGAFISDFKSALKDKNNIEKNNYKLCLDSENSYIYCTGGAGEKKTPFYKYIEIKQLKDSSGNIIKDSFKINSVVYWNLKGIHKVEIPTILANYKRL